MPGLVLEIGLIALLLAVNAFLAASEISIVSVRKSHLRTLAGEGNVAAKRVLKLVAHPSKFLATIQIGITLASFFASAIGAVSLVGLLTRWLRDVPVTGLQNSAAVIALVLVTGTLSFASIVLGELVPKTVAVQRAESLSLRVARPIQGLSWLMRPVVALLTAATDLVATRLLRAQRPAGIPSVTQEEMLAMLSTAETEGVVEAEEADLIEDAFEFGETLARTVMVPRVHVVAVEGETPLREVVQVFFQSGFSRLPVYRGSLDDLLGVLYIKDAFRLLWSDPATGETPVREIARPAYFVPTTKPIDELLAELRARRTHIAIVLDEFGGMAGLVTLEDVIEELVGEITDEFDPGYEPFRQTGPGTFQIDGRTTVADLLDWLDLKEGVLGPFEAESVGGLITEHLGRIPEEGDTVHVGVLRLTVASMLGNRVVQVRGEYDETAVQPREIPGEERDDLDEGAADAP